MFSKAQDLYKMQKEAKAMQKKMKKVVVSGYSKNELVEVKMNGTNELEDIDIDPSLIDDSKKQLLEKSIIEAIKDASKRLQKELVKGMDMDQMKSVLGM